MMTLSRLSALTSSFRGHTPSRAASSTTAPDPVDKVSLSTHEPDHSGRDGAVIGGMLGFGGMMGLAAIPALGVGLGLLVTGGAAAVAGAVVYGICKLTEDPHAAEWGDEGLLGGLF